MRSFSTLTSGTIVAILSVQKETSLVTDTNLQLAWEMLRKLGDLKGDNMIEGEEQYQQQFSANLQQISL